MSWDVPSARREAMRSRPRALWRVVLEATARVMTPAQAPRSGGGSGGARDARERTS
jgi:hypothetical protein